MNQRRPSPFPTNPTAVIHIAIKWFLLEDSEGSIHWDASDSPSFAMFNIAVRFQFIVGHLKCCWKDEAQKA